ncbi:MAG: dihydrofolate reductase [Alphaproteobacteria bacterium]|nr:dihydrofolate reductase [Alphaproteobacteria bacterium]
MYRLNNKPIICGITAIGPYNVIGYNGGMPWHSKADFYHFKTTTMSFPCLFGRNTYENLPRKPLPGRLNIVCSSKYKNEYKDDVFYARSVEDAIRECKNFDQMFICGGTQIYKYALEHNLIDIMYLTQIFKSSLEKEIELNRSGYDYFPISKSEFFDVTKWQTEIIKYSPDVLPVENNPITCQFFKCVRIR